MTGPAVDPLISAIIPASNGDRHLAAAIQSVVSQSPPAEVLRCRRRSTDRPPEVAKDSAGQYHHRRPTPGAGGGNPASSGRRRLLRPFSTRTTSGRSDKLEGQVAALRADPGLDIVCGHAEQFGSRTCPAEARVRGCADERPMPAACQGALLVRRPVFGESLIRPGTRPRRRWTSVCAPPNTGEDADAARRLRRRVHGANHGIVRRDARQDSRPRPQGGASPPARRRHEGNHRPRAFDHREPGDPPPRRFSRPAGGASGAAGVGGSNDLRSHRTTTSAFRLLPPVQEPGRRRRRRSAPACALKGIYRFSWCANQRLFHDAAGAVQQRQDAASGTLVLKGAAPARSTTRTSGLAPCPTSTCW
jgi:hypothetical protein